MTINIDIDVKVKTMLTIKQLTQAVGQSITPRMVRHYHQIGLPPPPERSTSNYRLYNEADVQQLLETETQAAQSVSEKLWSHLDAATSDHPENFWEALQHLLPDLSQRPEIEVDVLSHLVLACGDVSFAAFVKFSKDAIKAARESLQAGCTIIGDVPAVIHTLDQTRLAHLGCHWMALIDNPHINNAADAEQTFWQETDDLR